MNDLKGFNDPENELGLCKMKHANLTVLVEPTSSCNMDCVYCYKGEKPAKFMTAEIMETMFSKILSYNESGDTPCSFVWHGGEPSLVGDEFYEKVFKYLDEIGSSKRISHTMQTNGTLLTDKLLDVLAEYKVSIGVSLDGPAQYHNTMRPFKKGDPSYDKIMDGLQRAKGKGIEIGILMSITNDNIQYIKEMFEFCRANKFTFGLNPISSDLHSLHTGIEVTPENYLKGCIEAFDLWLYQKDFSIQMNPGFGVTRLILSRTKLSDCFMSENCQMHFISIGPEGDIYPCNRFYGLERFKLGNIVTDDLAAVLTGQKHRYLLERGADKIKECRQCSIAEYCNGGCMHHAVVHHDEIYSPDHLCLVYRGLFEHAISRLSQELVCNQITN